MKMEITCTLISVSCVFSVLFFLASKILYSVWLKPKCLEKCLRAQGLNGNPYRLLVGDMKDLGKLHNEALSKPINFSDDILSRVSPFLVEIIKKYGNNSFFWLGPTPSVLILDPETVKEIFINYNRFLKRPGNAVTDLLQKGLISYEGEEWEKHRRIINPAFYKEKLKHMVPAFHLSVKEMLGEWEAIVSHEGKGELDVWPHLQRLTSDALSRTAFGSSYEEGRKIFELQREQVEHLMTLSRSFFLPIFRFLPTKRNRRMKYIAKEVSHSIKEIIENRLKAIKEGEANSKHDLLGLLLESNQKEIQMHGHRKFGITTKEVIEDCKLFYVAGQETTSVLLVWTLVLLARHQEWQSRAREEVLEKFGKNQPDFEGLNHLQIVTMILNETLRLYPPIIFLDRTIQEDTKIGSLSLPSGTLVTIPIILLHYDTKIWGGDAKDFKPERFAEGVSNATKGQSVFLPFGGGPRMCIGQNFTMVEAKLALTMILQNFSFELSTSYSHAPHTVFTLVPQHGAHLILRKL